jgi:hypothetical protein
VFVGPCETSYYPPGAWNFEVASEYLEKIVHPCFNDTVSFVEVFI